MKFKFYTLLASLIIITAQAQKKQANLTSVDALIKNGKPVVEKVANGTVNWTQQFIEAKGQSVIDTTKFKNKAQAKAMAIRGATVVAQRNLLEIVKGVNIVGETTVEDMITSSDHIHSRVEGVIKGATMVGEPTFNDGLVEVTMRVAIYSADGLAPIVLDSLDKIIAKETSKVDTSKSTSGTVRDTTVKSTSTSGTIPANEEIGKSTDGNVKPFVFNLNGQKIDPAMFPIVTDTSGNLVLDLSKFYDPKKGKFPQYIQLGKDIAKTVGFQKGVEVIDVIQNSNGKLVVSEKVKKKINWSKISSTAKKLGKLAMLFI